MWRSWNPLALLVGILNGVYALETVWQFLKKLKVELSYNTAISLTGIQQREMKAYVHTKTSTQILIIASNGVPLWHSRLRIWHCPCRGMDCCGGVDLIPDPGTSMCLGKAKK